MGRDTLEGAKRELKEETGLVAANWELLLNMHLSNSVSDEWALVYLATDLYQSESEPEETEQLAIRKIPFSEVFQMVETGVITDAMSVAAILKTQLRIIGGRPGN